MYFYLLTLCIKCEINTIKEMGWEHKEQHWFVKKQQPLNIL